MPVKLRWSTGCWETLIISTTEMLEVRWGFIPPLSGCSDGTATMFLCKGIGRCKRSGTVKGGLVFSLPLLLPNLLRVCTSFYKTMWRPSWRALFFWVVNLNYNDHMQTLKNCNFNLKVEFHKIVRLTTCVRSTCTRTCNCKIIKSILNLIKRWGTTRTLFGKWYRSGIFFEPPWLRRTEIVPNPT